MKTLFRKLSPFVVILRQARHRVRFAYRIPFVVRYRTMNGAGNVKTALRYLRANGICLLCASVLVLSGCMSTTQTRRVHHYALGAPVAASAGHRQAAAATRGVLKIPRISVPPWLAGTAMYYRLDYRGDGRLSAYGQSDWVAPPATLLEPLVQAALATGGRWRAVVGPHSSATADASLQLRLQDFSQAFASPEQSTGVIDATATLLDNADADVIAQKHFHVAVPASGADARGGAAALRTASHDLARQIAAWLKTVPVSPRGDGASR